MEERLFFKIYNIRVDDLNIIRFEAYPNMQSYTNTITFDDPAPTRRRSLLQNN